MTTESMHNGTAGKPRVLFIINSLTGGGAERVMSTLLSLSGARTAAYDISLVLLDDEPAAYDLPAWLTVHQLNCGRRLGASIRQLRQVIRSVRPDITLSFLTRANVANGIGMVGRGRPWIISERINTSRHLGEGVRGAMAKFLVRAIYPRATKIIAVSLGVGDELVRKFGVPKQNIEVIANPVDTEFIRAQSQKPGVVDEATPYVLALGRLVEAKNFELLIRAFAKSGVPGRLVIGGEGPLHDKLEKLSAELEIADRVSFPGFLPNPYAALSRASVFASSSNVEGFPNALVEALLLDVPVVATNCPNGPAEILLGKRVEEVAGLTEAPLGILTPVGNVETFAEALKLVFDPAVRDRIAARTRERMKDYSPGITVDRYWDVIERALATRGEEKRALAPSPL